MHKTLRRINRILLIYLCSIILTACSSNVLPVYTDPESQEVSIPEKSISKEESVVDEEDTNFEDNLIKSADQKADPVFDGYMYNDNPSQFENETEIQPVFAYDLVPEYDDAPSVIINDNIPFFTDKEREEWLPGTEAYPELDDMGRCGAVYGCIGEELMPEENEEREAIGMIKPSGWQTIKFPELIEDLYLYNRCHLIGWQLGGENANECNLITGTRYFNISGMLPYENTVASYIRESGNHVLYRVTPYFEGDELIARGVLIEAESLEDDKLLLCVWCYNVQPGIDIDYVTGESREIQTEVELTRGISEPEPEEIVMDLILNTNTKRAHLPDCLSVEEMKPKNRAEYHGTVEELIEKGYKPCGRCCPF